MVHENAFVYLDTWVCERIWDRLWAHSTLKSNTNKPRNTSSITSTDITIYSIFKCGEIKGTVGTCTIPRTPPAWRPAKRISLLKFQPRCIKEFAQSNSHMYSQHQTFSTSFISIYILKSSMQS